METPDKHWNLITARESLPYQAWSTSINAFADRRTHTWWSQFVIRLYTETCNNTNHTKRYKHIFNWYSGQHYVKFAACQFDQGADPGFSFGKSTGRGFGGLKSPSKVQGQSPGGGLGAKPPEARRMLRHEAKNHLRREVHTDWHCMKKSLSSSTSRPLIVLCFRSFLSYNTKRSLRAPEPVKLSTVATGLIKRVSWKEHYRDVRKLVK